MDHKKQKKIENTKYFGYPAISKSVGSTLFGWIKIKVQPLLVGYAVSASYF